MSRKGRSKKEATKDTWLDSFTQTSTASVRSALDDGHAELDLNDDAEFRSDVSKLCLKHTNKENTEAFVNAVHTLANSSKTLIQVNHDIDKAATERLKDPSFDLEAGWQEDFERLARIIDTGCMVAEQRIQGIGRREAKRARLEANPEKDQETQRALQYLDMAPEKSNEASGHAEMQDALAATVKGVQKIMRGISEKESTVG